MAQQNPWEMNWQGAQPITLGTPDPTKQAAESRAQAENARAEARARREQLDWDANHNPDGTPKDAAADIPGDLSKTGEDYLKTVPEPLAIQVRMMAEGRRGLPTGGFALTNPKIMQLIGTTVQYDPTFDAVDYNARAKTRADFTSGVSARNIKALNTALGHLGQLGDQIDGTASHSFTPLNAIENAGSRAMGSPGITKFTQTASALASELTQVFRGTGGAEADVKRYLDELSPNQSLAQKKATIANIASLLNSRLQALNDQYDKGMGGHGAPLQVLDPHAKDVLTTYLPGFDGGSSGGGPGGAGGPPKIGGGGNTVWDQPSAIPIQAAQGNTKTVIDPAVTMTLNAMLRNGASYDDINAFAQKSGFGPVNRSEVDAVRSYAAKHPDYSGSYVNAPRDVPTTLRERFSASTPAAVAANFANNVGFGVPGALAPVQMAILQNAHPVASDIGAVGGAIAGSEGLGAAGRAITARIAPRLLQRGAVAQYLRNLAQDTAWGTATGTIQGEDPASAAMQSAAGSTVGQLAGKSVGAIIGGVKVGPNVQYLLDREIPLTTGQLLSESAFPLNLAKPIEDAGTSALGLGDMINARRLEGLKAYNGAAFQDAGAPVGATTVNIGKQGIADLIGDNGSVSPRAYDAATVGVTVNLDPTFYADMARVARAGTNLPKDLAERFDKAGMNRVAPIVDAGQMTGDAYQQSMRGLKGYRAEMTKPGFEQQYRDALGLAMDGLTGQMNRAGGDGVVDALANADRAYRATKVLDNAVNAARNGSQSGENFVFTPAQLNNANFANAKKYGGPRPFADLANAGQAVLPSKIPDSGTGRRVAQLALAGSLTGGGAGLGYLGGDTQSGAEAGLGLAAMLALGGTRAGQKAINSALTRRTLPQSVSNFGISPDVMAAIAAQVRKRQGLLGSATAPLFLEPGQ